LEERQKEIIFYTYACTFVSTALQNILENTKVKLQECAIYVSVREVTAVILLTTAIILKSRAKRPNVSCGANARCQVYIGLN